MSFERRRSKFLREVLPGAPIPWEPGTPDNVKRAIILDLNAYNEAVDINNEYQTQTLKTEPTSSTD